MADTPASEPARAEILVEARALSKSYGHTRAAREVSFQLARGEILGFLGPNGAGKSTTLKMVTGILQPDAGTASVDGIDILEDPLEARRRFGYLPESLPLYWEMQVEEYLRFIARARGLEPARATARIDTVIDQLDLGRMRRRTTGALSKGFRQRVGIAQALLHDPPVLILDEPTNGLDPQQIVEIRALLRELARERAILFSTHILQEIAAICSRIMVIHQGRKIADGSPDELAAEETESPWRVLAAGGSPLGESARDALRLGEPTGTAERRSYPAGAEVPDLPAIEREVAAVGGRVVSCERARPSLEEVYLRLTGGPATVGATASEEGSGA
ncbi:MAG: ABC transporter ATP-binding protein [Planctomycetota bacterium]|jgi:ABC-2 type transport system ATP-binding protein